MRKILFFTLVGMLFAGVVMADFVQPVSENKPVVAMKTPNLKGGGFVSDKEAVVTFEVQSRYYQEGKEF